MIISRLEPISQTKVALILPTGPDGLVRLKLSACANTDTESLGYEQLAVFVENVGDRIDSQAVQGRHSVEGDVLTFSPYFPFEKGMTYLVRTKNPDPKGTYEFHPFRLGEKPIVDQPKVLHIYPSADRLPENLLRFYIYFNTPMKIGEALKHVRLIDAAGNVDPHAFMEFKQELWSPDGKRLTILFDPGRIKRGVSTNLELGPALLEGNHYYLSISTAWQDAYGQPLSEEITKEFEVVTAYRQCLTAKGLEIDKPKPNSSEPLSIRFDRVIDHALVYSMIQIHDEKTNLIVGHWEVLEQDRLIQFIPESSWQKGDYQIVIDSRMEDVAGNNLQTPLDQIESNKKNNIDSHQTIDFKISC
ncbi:MAG: hypothetical protein AAGD96_13760 [Chloroflexota bacterium]